MLTFLWSEGWPLWARVGDQVVGDCRAARVRVQEGAIRLRKGNLVSCDNNAGTSNRDR